MLELKKFYMSAKKFTGPWLQTGFAMCFVIGFASGCAYRNEGAIDYRKSDIAAGSGNMSIGRDFVESLQLATVFGSALGEKIPHRNYQGEKVRLVSLSRKSVASPAPKSKFTEQDSVSIRLKAAFINYYSEGGFSSIGDLITEGQYEPRGEIAVVVDVFQLGEANRSFDFSDKGIKKGRVVYFSKDVDAGQFMNFNNMPVYGPVTYRAAPIALDFGVMELDISDQVTMELLTKLAGLGAQAFPAAAPELKILSSFGESLVQKDTNDINARYTLLFDAPEGGHPDLPRTTLEVGNYVFIRSENRQVDVNWENLLLDENTGKIYIKSFEPYSEGIIIDKKTMVGVDYLEREYIAIPYTFNNYFTFQVNKNEKAIHIDLPNYDYSTLLTQLNNDAADNKTRLSQVFGPLEQIVIERTQIALFDEIRSHLGSLRRARLEYIRSKRISDSLDLSVKEMAQIETNSNTEDIITNKKTALEVAIEAAELKAKDFEFQLSELKESSSNQAAIKAMEVTARDNVQEIQRLEKSIQELDLTLLQIEQSTRSLVKTTGNLLRRFEKTWSLFEPSIRDNGAVPSSTSRCKLNIEILPNDEKTSLKESQCRYVLEKLEDIADVRDASVLNSFRVQSPKIKSVRKTEICKSLLLHDSALCEQ